jgi:LemA protein
VWIILALLAAAALWAVLAFNRMVRLRMQARAAWSQIDVQLRRRHELIPNLTEAVKGYMAHERATLEAVTRAREAARAAGDDVPARAAAEGALTGALTRMIGLAEAYPELRASENMQMLQEELASTENRIAFARQHFNDCVMDFNTAVGTFPNLLIAGPMGFAPQTMFEADEASRPPPAVRL